MDWACACGSLCPQVIGLDFTVCVLAAGLDATTLASIDVPMQAKVSGMVVVVVVDALEIKLPSATNCLVQVYQPGDTIATVDDASSAAIYFIRYVFLFFLQV